MLIVKKKWQTGLMLSLKCPTSTWHATVSTAKKDLYEWVDGKNPNKSIPHSALNTQQSQAK